MERSGGGSHSFSPESLSFVFSNVKRLSWSKSDGTFEGLAPLSRTSLAAGASQEFPEPASTPN